MKLSVDEFVSRLLALNSSIVTLSSGQAFDINSPGSDFKIGYEACHAELFKANLYSAIKETAGIVVREFDDTKRITVQKDGRILNLPCKNLYHFLAQDGYLHTIPADVAEQAQNTDASSGAALEPEKGVTFCEMTA